MDGLTFEDFDVLRELIHAHSGMRLADTKQTFLEVRLIDRLREHSITSPREYYHFLKYDPRGSEEIQQLVDAVTVNETWFFRETGPLLAWREAVLPGLLKGSGQVRIWSAGCSTGEEPYSVAMVLLEAGAECGLSRVGLLATDISQRVLDHARARKYDRHSLRFTEPDLVDAYFDVTPDGSFMIREQVGRMVRFGRANLVDPALAARVGPASMDLILCRNVIIYLDDPSRKILMTNFHAALKPGAHLILGYSETLAHTHAPFEVARVEGTIMYRKAPRRQETEGCGHAPRSEPSR